MSNLIEVLEENDVHISKKGDICLSDFVENVIESKNPEGYIKKIDDKFKYKGDYYIDENTCLEILNKSNFKRCKDILERIAESEEEDNSSIISVKDNLFQYEGTKFTSFFVEKDDDDWDVWLKAVEVAEYLEYKSTNKAINKFVDDENRLPYEKLIRIFRAGELPPHKKIDKQTIFINMSGFFNLIHNSKQKLAKQIKKWIDNEVLPELMKHGSYSVQPKKIDIKSFYNSVAISEFFMKAVMYIGYIGKRKNEHLFKYGLSRKMFERDYEQHSKHFDKFQVIFIGECNNCEQVESLFEKDMKMYGLHRQYTINSKKSIELFTISLTHTYETIIEHMKTLIGKFILPSAQEANNKINKLENVVDIYYKSEELKKLELQFKLSDNYKLELEGKETEIRRLEAERKLIQSKLKLERVIQGHNDFETDTETTKISIKSGKTRSKKRDVMEI